MKNEDAPFSDYERTRTKVGGKAACCAALPNLSGKVRFRSGPGPEEDAAVSTRLSLVRNLADFPFLPMCTEQERRSIRLRIESAVQQSGAPFAADMPAGDWLVEREVLGQGLEGRMADGLWPSAESPGLFLVVNELDHVTLRALAPGLQPQELWDGLNALDDALAPGLGPAFHPDWGYLSPAIDRIGTGLSVRVVLHVPGLAMEGALPELDTGAREAQCDLAAWRGTLAKPQGALVTIENAVTIGRHEEEFVHQVRQKAQELIAREREARQRMHDGPLARIARDAVCRSTALARSVRLLDYEEGLALLSGLRLGLAMGWVRGTDFPAVDHMRIDSQFVHIGANSPQALEPGGLDEGEMRAKLFRKEFRGVELAL